jgi:hypothetical protein
MSESIGHPVRPGVTGGGSAYPLTPQERDCLNCKHKAKKREHYPCRECGMNAPDMIPSRWEPK